MRILGQVNRTVNIHVTNKTEEDNNRVYKISIHQVKSESARYNPEYDLSEGNTRHPSKSLVLDDRSANWTFSGTLKNCIHTISISPQT